ncbi:MULTISPECIES: spore protease YyaC [Pelosinus]|uniref:Sporulation protein YyaC n=2 Tax=Pelosinus TaxID=365348 RepID=I9NU91_9FIRM|nr:MULTISPECIES: spore protease YyaC [Pelosinus]AJQ30079.1 sporulation protein YyaC [Pelosinus fermentans JBW45]MCC5467457.1 spore protease YyaC [Pelosinus baikalensis]
MLKNLFSFPKLNSELKLNINQPTAMYDIASHLRSIMQEATTTDVSLVILCIGTDRSTGDSLGPLTGTKLRSFNPYPHIYGTLDEPIHASNLKDSICTIQENITNPYIIAVDACLGRLENVGCVSLGKGSLKPGAAVHKDLPSVGDAYITGIVNVSGFMEHLVLQSTRLNLVMKMSDTIAHAISYGLRTYGK